VDRQLVESAPRGDKAAFVDLVRSRVDRLFALAHRILRDVDRPEDALQDALPAFGKFDERNSGPTTRLLQERLRLRVLDQKDRNVVIAFWTPSPEAFDANIEAAESILEGIEFDTGS
jgi:DNA-directed RNA polymerase specialized sigma24 family protein